MTRAQILAAAYPDVHPVPGEPTAYYVDSRTKPAKRGPYLCRLENYQWNGQCACKGFFFNSQPKLERGALPSESLRCPHLKRARAYHLDLVGPAMDRLHFHQPTNTRTNND